MSYPGRLLRGLSLGLWFKPVSFWACFCSSLCPYESRGLRCPAKQQNSIESKRTFRAQWKSWREVDTQSKKAKYQILRTSKGRKKLSSTHHANTHMSHARKAFTQSSEKWERNMLVVWYIRVIIDECGTAEELWIRSKTRWTAVHMIFVLSLYKYPINSSTSAINDSTCTIPVISCICTCTLVPGKVQRIDRKYQLLIPLVHSKCHTAYTTNQ